MMKPAEELPYDAESDIRPDYMKQAGKPLYINEDGEAVYLNEPEAAVHEEQRRSYIDETGHPLYQVDEASSRSSSASGLDVICNF